MLNLVVFTLLDYYLILFFGRYVFHTLVSLMDNRYILFYQLGEAVLVCNGTVDQECSRNYAYCCFILYLLLWILVIIFGYRPTQNAGGGWTIVIWWNSAFHHLPVVRTRVTKSHSIQYMIYIYIFNKNTDMRRTYIYLYQRNVLTLY